MVSRYQKHEHEGGGVVSCSTGVQPPDPRQLAVWTKGKCRNSKKSRQPVANGLAVDLQRSRSKFQHQKINRRHCTSLYLNEAKDDRVLPYATICKQPAPRSRQITTPTPRRSIFTGPMLFLTPNQQYESTEGQKLYNKSTHNKSH